MGLEVKAVMGLGKFLKSAIKADDLVVDLARLGKNVIKTKAPQYIYNPLIKHAEVSANYSKAILNIKNSIKTKVKNLRINRVLRRQLAKKDLTLLEVKEAFCISNKNVEHLLGVGNSPNEVFRFTGQADGIEDQVINLPFRIKTNIHNHTPELVDSGIGLKSFSKDDLLGNLQDEVVNGIRKNIVSTKDRLFLWSKDKKAPQILLENLSEEEQIKFMDKIGGNFTPHWKKFEAQINHLYELRNNKVLKNGNLEEIPIIEESSFNSLLNHLHESALNKIADGWGYKYTNYKWEELIPKKLLEKWKKTYL